MFLSILIPALIAFTATYLLIPSFVKLVKAEGIVGYDQMKKGKPAIPEMGTPPILFGLLGGIFSYVAAQTFIIKAMPVQELLFLMASITTILIITFIGTLDVLTSLIKPNVIEQIKGGLFGRYKRKGLRQWTQFILPFPAAIPLMAVAAGVSTIAIPFIGTVNIGLLYPLVLVPIAIVGASNATNMLAGFNGLEAGIGLVLSLFLGIFAYVNGQFGATLLAFVFVASLLAFLRFNWYPAKIFPGGLTYVIGAVIACVAIIGNMEKFAILCFAPFFLELLLKLRSKFKAENFGILKEDGTLKAPYKPAYSLTHIVMKLGNFNESQVSSIIIAGFAIWCTIIFWLV